MQLKILKEYWSHTECVLGYQLEGGGSSYHSPSRGLFELWTEVVMIVLMCWNDREYHLSDVMAHCSDEYKFRRG